MMKQLILLFTLLSLSMFAHAQKEAKLEVMNVDKLEQLEADSYKYVVLGQQSSVRLEENGSVFVDFSSADIRKQKIDSMQVILKNDTVVFNQFEAFLISDIEESIKMQVLVYSGGKTVALKSVGGDVAKLDIERVERPIFTNDMVVFGILVLVLALIFYTSSLQGKYWKSFYIIIPSLLLCYVIPAILDLLGLISKEYTDFYPTARDYMLPAALILMTLGIDFKGILNLGPKALIMFGTATVGIIIGGPIAIMIYANIDPSVVGGEEGAAAWRGFATLAGSWIGGGANQAAMLETYGYQQDLYGKMVTVDIVVANLWMAFLLWGAARAEKFDRWLKADSSSIETLKKTMTDYETSIAKKPTLTDYFIILGIAFGVVGIAHLAGGYLAGLFDSDSPFGKSFFWIVVIATTGGLILSATKLRKYEGAGASRIGSVFIYFLVATIGMKMELAEAVKQPQLILVGIIWMLVHVGLLFAVAKIIKAPFFFVAVGSKANVGGAASAPIIAAAFHPSLASVGAILAVVGYALGTYGAILAAEIMRMVAPV